MTGMQQEFVARNDEAWQAGLDALPGVLEKYAARGIREIAFRIPEDGWKRWWLFWKKPTGWVSKLMAKLAQLGWRVTLKSMYWWSGGNAGYLYMVVRVRAHQLTPVGGGAPYEEVMFWRTSDGILLSAAERT